MNYTKEQLIEAIAISFPYSQHIRNWDISTEQNAIRFDWRSDRFRVSTSGMVEEVKDSFLAGSNKAILAEQLIKQQLVSMFMAKAEAKQ